MSEATQEATGVKAQYGAQVAADLEHNTKERERVRAELTSLEEQLNALEHDRTLLLGVQQALGSENSQGPAAQVPDSVAASEEVHVPQPRASRTPASRTPAKETRAKKAGKTKSTGDKAPKAAPATTGPTLVALVRDLLGGQSEPRSAAEITSALAQAHPDRDVKTTVVRTTLEGLVAKAQAHRAKQGASVRYSASGEQPVQAAEAAALSAK
ncbi:hypothetical protein [Streptomyces sp. NPDC049040]|uniref:hypothetical protein n=1 Tax=Streptomyces sp. NPDC049040 TaxID=3365593 RepID=UPI00371DB759